MNDLINTTRQTPIEVALGIDENGRTTAKKLYEFLELNPGNFARWCKSNITENQFAEENKDFVRLFLDEETPTGGKITREDYKLTASFAKKLSMAQKNERGEEARNYFVGVEDGAKEMVIQYQEMSPQLQFMINMEAEQKRQAREQVRQAQEITSVKETQKTIAQALGKDIIEDFRSWVSRSLSAIAESNNYPYIGSQQERHQAVRKESYERLNAKRPCRLDQRVDGERGRAAAAGASQTKVKAINKLTIIEGDKDLKPVYESVIREMLVAYCVTVK